MYRKLDDLQTSGLLAEGDHGRKCTVPPAWFERDRYERGQQFFWDHLVSATLNFHLSLAIGMVVPNLLQPLVFTGQSDTPVKSIRRYARTYRHIRLWHSGDIFDQNSKAHESIMQVRKMHRQVAGRMNGSSDKDAPAVSMYDMALVQAGFFAGVVLHPRLLGIDASPGQLRDYAYLWRCFGYALGISDEVNLAGGSYAECLSLASQIENEIIVRNIRSPPSRSLDMQQAYLAGVNSLFGFPLCSMPSIYHFALPQCGCVSLSWADWLRVLFLRIITFSVFYVPFLRRSMGQQIESIYRKMTASIEVAAAAPLDQLSEL